MIMTGLTVVTMRVYRGVGQVCNLIPLSIIGLNLKKIRCKKSGDIPVLFQNTGLRNLWALRVLMYRKTLRLLDLDFQIHILKEDGYMIS